MARNKKDNFAEVFLGAISRLPWWAGVAIAIVSYLYLHGIAQRPIVTPQVTSVQGLAGAIWPTLLRTFAHIGQYVIPLLCCIGAFASWVHRKKGAGLLRKVAKGGTTEALNQMSWQEFEQMVGEWFRREGYQVSEVGGGGRDGGIDLIARKDGKRYLVQCKQWRSTRVGVKVVRELYGVAVAERAAGAFVVTSGSFTNDAWAFAKGKHLRLLDAAEIVRSLKAAPQVASPPRASAQATSPETAYSSQECSKCGAPMLKRMAKRGANAGHAFLGCSNYPSCREVAPLPGGATK